MFRYYIVYDCEYSDERAFVRVISTEPVMDVTIDHIALSSNDGFGISAPLVFDDEHKIVPLIEKIQYPVDKEMGKIYVRINPKWNLRCISTDARLNPMLNSIYTPIKL